MKNLFFTFTIAGLFLYGCAQVEAPQASAPQDICPNPLAQIHIESITAEQNDLDISTKFVQSLLQSHLKDNCLTLTDTPNQDTYQVKITYKTALDKTSDETIATSKMRNIINSSVKISLKNATKTKTFQGKSTLDLKEKKVLSIGQDASLTQERKEKAFSDAFNAAYQAIIQNFESQAQ